MSYVAQGTIQLRQTSGGQAVVLMSPTPDFCCSIKDKKMIVFIEESINLNEATIFPSPFEINASNSKEFLDILTKASLRNIVVEIKVNNPKSKTIQIEYVQIPAKA